MSYYELGIGHIQKYGGKNRLILAKICKLKQVSYIVLIFEQGIISVLHQNNNDYALMKEIKIVCKNRIIHNILKIFQFQMTILIQTFKEMYTTNITLLLQNLQMDKYKKEYEVSLVEFSNQRKDITSSFVKLSNKQLKLLKYKEKLCIKLCGRLSGQIFYFFCELVSGILILRQYYSCHCKNQFRISIQSLDKDIIIYQSYSNKFKPIKLSIISYHNAFQPKDSEIVQKLQINQFEERYTVICAYKIGIDIICLITNSHYQTSAQSNIILFNYHLKYAVINLTIKDIIIFQTSIFGNQPKLQFTYNNHDLILECIGNKNDGPSLIQILPFCSYRPDSTALNKADYFEINANMLIAYCQNRQELTIYHKISKNAIYYKWLQQKFSKASSIFDIALRLLN